MNSDLPDHDPEACRRLQLTYDIQVYRKSLYHPGFCYIRCYPVWFWKIEIDCFHHDLPTVVYTISMDQGIEWLLHYCMTGNIEERNLVGEDLIFLGILLIVYPQWSQNEMAIFILSEGSGLYSKPLI